MKYLFMTFFLLITFSLYPDSKVQNLKDIQKAKLVKAEAYISALKRNNEQLRTKYEEQKRDNSDKELLKSLLKTSVIFIVILLLIIFFLCTKLKSIDEREQKG
jgi:hypothetical protein